MTPACTGDPAFIYVQLCNHLACIGGLAFIRSRRLIEEIWYIGLFCCGYQARSQMSQVSDSLCCVFYLRVEKLDSSREVCEWCGLIIPLKGSEWLSCFDSTELCMNAGCDWHWPSRYPCKDHKDQLEQQFCAYLTCAVYFQSVNKISLQATIPVLIFVG